MEINIIKQKIKNIVAPYRLLWGHYYDYKRFIRSSFEFNRNKLSNENLRAEITFVYHAIEKGLSHNDLRLGFGQDRINRLLFLLKEWIKRDYDRNDIRFITGIAVLDQYILIHKNNNFDVSTLDNELKFIKQYANDLLKVQGGIIEATKEDFLVSRLSEFKQFSESRRSIRNYGEKKIKTETIIKAVNLAQNAPSVCNRQSSKVYIIKRKSVIKECLEIQNGIQGMAKNISALLLVTSDNSYFGNLNERNQSFVDGGIYSMNLLYSLTYYGVASCALNADLNTKAMEKLREILHIPDSQDIIMFISCGSYPQNSKFPVSNRDSADDTAIIVE